MCKSNIPAACLKGHGDNYSPFDYTNWLPVSLPSFEPLHFAQLIVTTVYADIPSDRSLGLSSHLPLNLGSVSSFGSFFVSCYDKEHGDPQALVFIHFQRFFIPYQRGASCIGVTSVSFTLCVAHRCLGTVLLLPHGAVEWQ